MNIPQLHTLTPLPFHQSPGQPSILPETILQISLALDIDPEEKGIQNLLERKTSVIACGWGGLMDGDQSGSNIRLATPFTFDACDQVCERCLVVHSLSNQVALIYASYKESEGHAVERIEFFEGAQIETLTASVRRAAFRHFNHLAMEISDLAPEQMLDEIFRAINDRPDLRAALEFRQLRHATGSEDHSDSPAAIAKRPRF